MYLQAKEERSSLSSVKSVLRVNDEVFHMNAEHIDDINHINRVYSPKRGVGVVTDYADRDNFITFIVTYLDFNTNEYDTEELPFDFFDLEYVKKKMNFDEADMLRMICDLNLQYEARELR